MIETFDFVIGTNATGEIQQDVNISQFSDGYSQSSTQGMNSQHEEWSIEITKDVTEIAPIRAFLDRHKGAKAFYWTPPAGEQGLYRNDKGYSLSHKGNNKWTLTTNFVQTFEASADDLPAEYVKTVNNTAPDTEGNVTINYVSVGAEKAGATAEAIEALKKETDPFPKYALHEELPDLSGYDKLNKTVTGLSQATASLTDELGSTNDELAAVVTTLETLPDQLSTINDAINSNTNSIDTLTSTVTNNTKAIAQLAEETTESFTKTNEVIKTNIEAVNKTITDKVNELKNTEDLSKGAGQVAYNADLSYADKTVGKELQTLTDKVDTFEQAGVPLFSVFWWPSRESIPPGYVAADGQELPLATYPDAAKGINDGMVPTTTESDWQTILIKRGCYVALSSTGFFRMPDYNGVYADSLGALFLRGGNDTLADGDIQRDGVGNVKVPVGYSNYTQGFGTNYADNKTHLMPAIDVNNNGGHNNHASWGVEYKEALNSMNLGAKDTRPLNVTGCWVVKLFGAVTEIGKVDAKQLAADYANLAAKLSILQSHQNKKRFTIIYPNGGTQDSPANIATNSRYIEGNPFPNEPVLCELEIYVNGIWGTANWIDNWGASAHHDLESDKIIIQTGASGLAVASNRTGGSLGLVTPNIPTAPCRVKVWRP